MPFKSERPSLEDLDALIKLWAAQANVTELDAIRWQVNRPLLGALSFRDLMKQKRMAEAIGALLEQLRKDMSVSTT
jgi:hypothetical protein